MKKEVKRRFKKQSNHLKGEERTIFAEERTVLARERTFLATVRTVVGVVGLFALVYKLFVNTNFWGTFFLVLLLIFSAALIVEQLYKYNKKAESLKTLEERLKD